MIFVSLLKSRVWCCVSLVFLMSCILTAAATSVQFGPNILIGGNNPFANYDREPSIAVNPLNSNNLVIGYISRLNARDGACNFSSTFDGGATWSPAVAAPLRATLDVTRCVDPSLVADLGGNFYFAYIDGDIDNAFKQATVTIDVAKSTDGGRTFPTFSLAVPASESGKDKPFLAVDARPASPHRGNLLTYTRLTFAAGESLYQILERTSRDGARPGRTRSSSAALRRFPRRSTDPFRWWLRTGPSTCFIWTHAISITPTRPTSCSSNRATAA